MMQLIIALLFLAVVAIIELVITMRAKKRDRIRNSEYRVGMIAVRRLIDDIENGRIIR